MVALRDKERGLVGLPVIVWSGDVPMPAKEKGDGMGVFDEAEVPFVSVGWVAGFCTWGAEELVLGVSAGLMGFSLTINCSPSSRVSRSLNLVDAEY